MKRIILILLSFICPFIMVYSCFFSSSNVKKYFFPQVGLYVTTTFHNGDGFVMLSRDGYVTSLSEEVDYIMADITEVTGFSLILKPDTDTLFFENSLNDVKRINQKEFVFVPVEYRDSTFYYEKSFPNLVTPAIWVKPDYFTIIISYMLRLDYKEMGEDKEILHAMPLLSTRDLDDYIMYSN